MFEILLEIAILAAAVTVLLTGAQLWLHRRQKQWQAAQKYVLLQIRVSRENERQPIVAEHIFAALHGVTHELSFGEKLRGHLPDHFSFEVANVDGQIRFFVHTPAHLQAVVESQLYAQYADIEITQATDYLAEPAAEIAVAQTSTPATTTKNLAASSPDFHPLPRHAHAVGAELKLASPHINPIKRYPQFEDKLTQTAVDPLAAITSALSKLPHAGDRAAVQIVVRPLGDWWRQQAVKCIRILGKGLFFNISKLQTWYAEAFLTRKIWPRIIFFPLYLLFYFHGLGSGKASLGEGAVQDDAVLRAHDRESSGAAMMDKAIRLAYDCTLRVLYLPVQPDSRRDATKVRELTGAFKQFSLPHLNSFAPEGKSGTEFAAEFAARALGEPQVLSVEELATIFHLPTQEVKTPNIFWVTSKKLEPPHDLPDPARETLTQLGSINYRGLARPFGIRPDDRRRHIYIIGKTGMGKSTLLENMILSDILEGKGVAVVDPHGDLAEHILECIPSNRTNDVIVFDPSDREHPVAFNMLENIDPTMNTVVASGMVGIFKKIYAESWGPRLEHILRNTVLSLLEYPNTTMLGIPRILVDANFRRLVVRKVTDPVVRKFWKDEFEAMQPKQLAEAVAPIQNKVGQFLSSPIIRNIVGQPKSMIDMRYAMDHRKIVICNLSKGKIGEDNSSLLGSMLITKFQLDAMSRSNIPEKDRVDFYLYVDEFQNFATDSFATILSEARKYRLNLTMANQYIAQMSEEVQGAVFGNVGTLMTFQVGYDDAEYISKQFSEIVTPNDLVQLPKYNLYLKLMVDGMPTQPFSAATLPPIGGSEPPDRREKVVRLSRERYAKKREVVEDKIRRWSEGADTEEGDKKLPSGEKKSLPAGGKKPAK